MFGRTYTPAQIGSIDAKIKFAKYSPYAGIGYKISLVPVSIHLELGILFQGSPKINVSATGTSKDSPQLITDVKNDLEKSANRVYIKYYPVIGISVLI